MPADTAFVACAKCGTPLVITPAGLVYCPTCDPQCVDKPDTVEAQGSSSFIACPKCGAPITKDENGWFVCPNCGRKTADPHHSLNQRLIAEARAAGNMLAVRNLQRAAATYVPREVEYGRGDFLDRCGW